MTKEISTKRNGYNVSFLASVNETTNFLNTSKEEGWKLNKVENYLMNAILEEYLHEKGDVLFSFFQDETFVVKEEDREDTDGFFLQTKDSLFHITFNNVTISKFMYNNDALIF